MRVTRKEFKQQSVQLLRFYFAFVTNTNVNVKMLIAGPTVSVHDVARSSVNFLNSAIP